MLASADSEKTVRLWDRQTRLNEMFDKENGEITGTITDMRFSPDEKILAVAWTDGPEKSYIDLIIVETGKKKAVLKGKIGPTNGVVFH